MSATPLLHDVGETLELLGPALHIGGIPGLHFVGASLSCIPVGDAIGVRLHKQGVEPPDDASGDNPGSGDVAILLEEEGNSGVHGD